MDKRVEKTYVDLQRSLRESLGRETWDRITVRKLCERAGVSRTTFYSHFTGKDDLLDSLLVSFERAMREENNERSLSTNGKLCFLPLMTIHVSENRRLFAATNRSTEGYPVASRFRALITRMVTREFEETDGVENADVLLAEFVGGGIYSTLVAWSASSTEPTHLALLERIDRFVRDARNGASGV